MYDYKKEQLHLQKLIRPVDKENDCKLPTFSHSKLETFENCNYRYYLKYMQGKRSQDTTLPLQLGTLCHYIYELAAKEYKIFKFNKRPSEYINYEKLNKMFHEGDADNNVIGIDEIKQKYWESWNIKDTEGRDYNEKIENFWIGIKKYFENMNEWEPYKEEHPFKFVYKDRAIITGFIDAILINDYSELMCLDFKTSKKVFSKEKIPTSQQFALYCMAILNDFKKMPVKCEYDFIFLNIKQSALTTGFAKRIEKKMDKVLDKIDGLEKSGVYQPSPTPLCAWCPYSKTNPDAHQYKFECEYHSNWTPINKVWTVNKEFDPEDMNKPKRALIF